MGVATFPAMVVAGAATAVEQSRQITRGRLRHWLPVILFAVLIGAQTVARTGDFAGFVDSTKPARWAGQTFTTADGYVLFWNGIPVNGDARSFLALTRFLQGQQGPADTGIYDRRAGYSYFGSLVSLLLGHYQSFVALNALAWLGATLAMYWLGGRLLNSRLAAWTAGTLTATGQGFSFMVGTPVSTLLGFASVAVILAFVEWSGLLRPPFRWRDWLHTHWLVVAVSLFYPVYLMLLAFIWLYGLRRAPFIRLLGHSAMTLVLALAWMFFGSIVVGLEFDTANSALLPEALDLWWSALSRGPSTLLNTVRIVASAGTTYAAFPGVILVVAGYGYLVGGQGIRRWALTLCLATLVAALLFTIRYAIPRTSFFAYPAIYLLAAAGMVHLARVTANWRSCGALSVIVVILGLLLLVAPSLPALVGHIGFDVSFHFWTSEWGIATDE